MIILLYYINNPYLWAGLGALALLALWLFWRWLMMPPKLHKDHYRRLAESYDLIQSAYLTICAQNFVTDIEWEKIREADWLAKYFLPKELRLFTRQWVKKATTASLLHKNIGRFGHLDIGGTKALKIQVADAIFSVENKNDEAQHLAWFKENEPKQFYRNYLPTLPDEVLQDPQTL